MISDDGIEEFEKNHLYIKYLKEETNNTMDDLEDDAPEIVKQQYKDRLDFIQKCNENGIMIPEDF